MKIRTLLIAIVAFGCLWPVRAQAPTLGTYIRTVGELRAALADHDDNEYIGVAVGRYAVAPLRADLRTLSVHCGRAGWWDNHLGGSPDAVVIVLDESTREEAGDDATAPSACAP